MTAPSAPVEAKSRRKWALAVGLIFAVVVAAASWQATRVRSNAIPKGDPVVAVLAFANMSGDPKQEYFSDGLTESIIDNLAQVRELKVIARNSSFRYKGQAADVRKIGEELGAKYLIEGSVRRSQETVRVTAQLINATSGGHLWSKTFDRALTPKNLFAIQDEIASAIVATIAGFYGVLHQEEATLAKRKPPTELSSYDCVLLGMNYYKSVSLETFRAARDCVEKAVKVDPEYAPVWNLLAIISRAEFQFNYDPRPGSLDRALDAAQRAIRLDPGNAEYQAEVAVIHSFRGERSEFIAAANRAIEMSPRGTSGFANLGVHLCFMGEWERGLALVERAKVLDPFFPGWYHVAAFHDHYRKKQYSDALQDADRVNIPTFVQAAAMTVAAYGQLGKVDEAQPYIRRIFELDPSFDARAHWTARFRFQPEYLEHLLDGMRKAGMKVSEKKH